ncbi:MAG: archaeosortase/exosortase family protein [Myxococcales bacterium]|nr:archaeosortase/exosortase family protein [Myxococcales bacterium]
MRTHPGKHSRHHRDHLRQPLLGGNLASRRSSPLRFAARFSLVAGALFLLYAYPYPPHGFADRLFQHYLDGYARLVAFALQFFEPDVRAHEAVIFGRSTLKIVKSCDAMEAKLLMASALAASPGVWWRKLTAIAVGLLVMTAVNVARIMILYYVRVYRDASFELFHVEILPLFMILSAGALFLASLRFLHASDPEPPPPSRGRGASGRAPNLASPHVNG